MQVPVSRAADEIVGVGFANEDVVLRRRVGDQPRPGVDCLTMSLRRRMPPIAEQGLDMEMKRRQAVTHVVGASGRDLQERGEIARHRIGAHRFRLDHAGISVAGLAARLPAVDQRAGPAALLEVQRRADADHAAAEDDRALHRKEFSCQAVCGMSFGSAVLMVAATTTDNAVIATRKPKAASNDPVPVTMKPIATGATKPALWPPRLTMPMPDPIWSSRSSLVGSAITEASTKDLKK